jgi:hypothetical protein
MAKGTFQAKICKFALAMNGLGQRDRVASIRLIL